MPCMSSTMLRHSEFCAVPCRGNKPHTKPRGPDNCNRLFCSAIFNTKALDSGKDENQTSNVRWGYVRNGGSNHCSSFMPLWLVHLSTIRYIFLNEESWFKGTVSRDSVLSYGLRVVGEA
jgi:hypothetical protein